MTTWSDEEYQRTRRAWGRIWQHVDLDEQLATRHYPRSIAIRDRFVPFLPADARLLEAGCGPGVELLALTERGFRVVGMDYTVDPLKQVRTILPAGQVLGGDVHALPFASEVFGAYLSFGVLEHFRFGPDPALREANRVLRTGGTLVLTIPSPNLVWRLARLRSRARGARQGTDDTYFETTYRADDLAARVRHAGFDVDLCEPVSHEFTLWTLGGPFRAPGYYRTSRLAVRLGAVFERLLPQAMGFATLIVARKARAL